MEMEGHANEAKIVFPLPWTCLYRNRFSWHARWKR